MKRTLLCNVLAVTLSNAHCQGICKVIAAVQEKEKATAILTFLFKEVLSYSCKVSTLLNEIFYLKMTVGVFKNNYHYQIQIQLPRNFKVCLLFK